MGTVFFRTLFIYFTVLLVMRLMGKREVGQLSTFDLVVAIMIAEIAVFPMQELQKPLYMGVIPMFILVGAEIFISYLCLHCKFLRRFVDGYPSVLIAEGKIMEKEMRKQRYNINDLMGQLRQKNVFNILDVEYAILETSGELSVMLKNTKRSVTPEDLNLNPAYENIPAPLVLDGEVLPENLEYLGLSRIWLEDELKRYGLELKNVLYASMDCQGKLYISEKLAPVKTKNKN
ncbi:MAG: DUF421 domain-containing protein [Dethiobacter sp.]|nr:MAG: DUF421 domain-containing protein [Dethiobacter sp.]